MKDRIFREPLSKLAGFEFDARVAEVFDDMLDRSIPFYAEVQRMIVDLVSHYYQEGSAIYDLGCSTGILQAKLIQAYPQIAHTVGVDSSEAMIAKARERLEAMPFAGRLELIHGDIRQEPIENASIVIMNYTLQFVRPLHRNQVVQQIFDGLLPGGIFILSEKVIEESNHLSRLFIDMYYRFKRRQGYTEMEISQKRERLENVLIPYQSAELRALLDQAGFEAAETFFKWNNFTSLIAVKGLD